MRSILFILGLVLANTVSGQQKLIKSTPQIHRVIVYKQGAQVERQSVVQLTAGRTDILVASLSPEIDRQSIQVKLHPDVQLLSLNHQVNHLREQTLLAEIHDLHLQDSLLKDRLALEQAMLQVYKQEEQMLQKNQDIRGDQGIRQADLREAMDYMRSKLTEILKKQLETSQVINNLTQQRSKILQQQEEVHRSQNKSTSDLVISVKTARAVESPLILKYLVEKASWKPVYDVRVNNVSKPIEIVQKAQIEQLSGETWKEVDLVLSSGDPREEANKPEIKTWYLSYYKPQLVIRGASSLNGALAGKAPGLESSQLQEVVVVGYSSSRNGDTEDNLEQKARRLEIPADVTVQTKTLQYEIKEPFTVPNDGKTYTTDIQHMEVPASFEYYAAPKLNNAVFLTAHINQWEELNLVSGETNLFFEGAFLGRSQLNTDATGDTLSISLGQDRSVLIQRKKVSDYTSRKFIGNNRVDSRGYEILIRNTKTDSIQLILEDQLPVSTEKDIEVDAEELSGGKREEKTGIVRWTLALAPRQEVKKTIGYKVRHPRDKPLVLE